MTEKPRLCLGTIAETFHEELLKIEAFETEKEYYEFIDGVLRVIEHKLQISFWDHDYREPVVDLEAQAMAMARMTVGDGYTMHDVYLATGGEGGDYH